MKDANKLNPTNKPQISTKLRTDSKKNNQKLTLTKNIIKSRSPAPLKKDTNCGTNYDYRNNGSPGVPGYIGKKIII